MKYYIDKRLAGQWEKFGIHPDDCEWISSESFFSTGEKEKVWAAVKELLDKYIVLYKKDLIQKSRKYRSMNKRGNPLDDEQAAISNRPAQLADEKAALIEKTIRGLIG